tara:strand:+ start:58 stop:468 length:411 start_codon:yes stop_codon:yes gene_type:complete
MAAKEDRIYIRVSSELKEKIIGDARSNNFTWGASGADFSKYLRWIFEKYDARPIDRELYEDLINFYYDMTRVGGLLNQYVFHLNRELKIINSHGTNAQNRQLIKSLDDMKEMYEILERDLGSIKILISRIIERESV